MAKFKIEGFIYREIGCKNCYGAYHPDVEDGKKLLGWVGKNCVKKDEIKRK